MSMQPRPSSAASSLAAQRAQSLNEPTGRPAWMANYRTPSQVGQTTGDIDRVRDLVGQTLIIHSFESGTSRTMGRFVRFMYTPIDFDTGEHLAEPTRCVAFAQPVVRFADALNGGTLDGSLVLSPPVLVRVDQAGDAILFVDPI